MSHPGAHAGKEVLRILYMDAATPAAPRKRITIMYDYAAHSALQQQAKACFAFGRHAMAPAPIRSNRKPAALLSTSRVLNSLHRVLKGA